MRPKKKILSIDVDSALMLMQEIYNDIAEQKSTATLITKKMLNFMKESDDMTLIGPVIKEQQKILNNCTEKKISLVKLQTLLLKQTGGEGKAQNFGKLRLSAEDKKFLEDFMKKEGEEEEEERDNDGMFKK